MPRLVLAALIYCLLSHIAFPLPLSPTTNSPGEQCRAAIAAAERGHAVPSQLLAAIGRVESGQRDPVTGIWGAWPWTINAEGQGSYFETRAEAIQAVEGLQARGVRSIDVGCMQINLMHHPTAFTTLDLAFEPAANADYAARFLVRLYGQTGDWSKAAANYHSANPDEGGPYAAKVTAFWTEEQRKTGGAPAYAFAAAGSLPYVKSVSPFAARQPGRLFAMAGVPAVMVPPASRRLGLIVPGLLSSGSASLNDLSPSPVTAGTASQGSSFPRHGAGPGHNLDFYRLMPITPAVLMRWSVRMPGR